MSSTISDDDSTGDERVNKTIINIIVNHSFNFNVCLNAQLFFSTEYELRKQAQTGQAVDSSVSKKNDKTMPSLQQGITFILRDKAVFK